ncbi:MAG: substrate-binding domain-containing protein [Victivallales bacterium]
MQAVVAAGLRVPEDIVDFCFDDMEFLSDRMGIPLSFIKMPLEKMGRLAAEYLIRKNRDRTSLPIHLVFENFFSHKRLQIFTLKGLRSSRLYKGCYPCLTLFNIYNKNKRR